MDSDFWTLISAAGQNYKIIKSGDWTIPEDDVIPGSSGKQPMLYTNGSDINLTMENIILDGGYESEDIISSDSGLLDFSGKEIILTNVTFQNNWKEWNGANFSGLNLNCSKATLDNCTFKDLHISGLGARVPGIYILKGDVTIKDCVFGNNSVDNENDDYKYGRDIWLDSSYSGNKVTVTGETRHLDESLEIGTYDPEYCVLGSETGKIKVSSLYDETVAAGLIEYGLEKLSENYNHGIRIQE